MSSTKTLSQKIPYIAKLSIVCAIYFITAKFGLELDAVSKFATLIWPPTGIALATLLLYGYRLWPGIFLGAFLVNVATGAPILVACGMGVGNTLEAVVGAYLLNRFADFHKPVDRIKDVISLVIFACALSTIVSATVGVLSLWLGQVKSLEGIGATWQAWWFGDVLGDLIVAPLILVWTTITFKRFDLWRTLEAVVFATALVAVGSIIFSETSHLAFWFFPFIVWAALRFGQIGNITAIFVICIVAIRGTAHGLGPFAQGLLRGNLFLLDSFMVVIATTGMMLAASVAERKFAVKEQARLLSSEEIANQRLMLQYRVMTILAESKTLKEGVTKILEIIGQDMSWDFGAFWIVDEEAQALKSTEIWSSPNIIVPEFTEATRTWQFSKGKGLPGRIWEDRKPAWISNVVDDPNFPRHAIANKEGLHGGFGFPILSGEKVLGVMEFFSREIRTPDKELLRAVAISGGQIGQYMNRLAAEESLRQAVQTRDEFLSIASHELKTPLTSLSLQIQMTKQRINLKENTAPSLDKLAKVFDVSEKQVARLTGLVEELLDASRIQTGKFSFNFEEINISSVVKDMVDRFSDQLKKAQCPLEVSIEENIIGYFDHTRIEQVVDNLLSNAIKYAPGKPVKVLLSHNSKTVELVVEDYGPGIPSDKRSKIFERFERASDSASVTGLGLGLFIVKEIAKGHNGSVHFENVNGVGSKFVVELPLDVSKMRV